MAFESGIQCAAGTGGRVVWRGEYVEDLKKIRLIYHRLIPIISTAACFFLAGCNNDDALQVRIFDSQIETRLSVKAGITVQEALAEAEITIEEGDIVSPSLNAVVSENTADISIGRHAKVMVVEDKQAYDIELIGGKVKDAVGAVEIEIGKNDYVSHSMEAYLTDGMEIEVMHRRLVGISVDGKQMECLTGADNVAGLLEEQGINLDEKDQITPGLDEALADGTKVVIQRVFVKRIAEREPIPYDTKTEYAGNMYEGETRKKQQGQDGEKEVIYEVTYVNGKEEHRSLVEEKVVKEPISSIIVKGTAARRRIVSRQPVYDCDGSGHGYYIITWSDGKVEYQDF